MALQLLIPLDGTEFSRQILPHIRRLFAPSHYHIHLLHVAEPPRPNYDPLAHPAVLGANSTFYAFTVEDGMERAQSEARQHPMYTHDELEGYREALEQDLETELSLFEEGGYHVTASVHFGEPAKEIAEFAEHGAVDMIAMATHGRTGLGRFLKGSVAQGVLQRTNKPVLLLRLLEAESGQGTTTDENLVKSESATLDDLPGKGVIRVMRASDGRVLERRGSWQPSLPHLDVTPLQRAYDEGRTLFFEGAVLDGVTDGQSAETPQLESHRERVQVEITGIHHYQTEDGGDLLVVNFVQPEPHPADLVT